jgi:hypothetical protein
MTFGRGGDAIRIDIFTVLMFRIKNRFLEGNKKNLRKFILKNNTKKGRNLGNRALIPVPPPPLTPQIIYPNFEL